jgi:uncharacterized membrane protein YdcZ (DUF606 family)
VILGFFTVLQGGLNRRIISLWGLPSAVGLNALVLFSFASLLFFVSYKMGERAPEILRVKLNWSLWQPWFVFPGLMGLALVFGIPWAISQWGALRTFMIVICSQILMSALWDLIIENTPLTSTRVIGAGLTILGAWLTTL